MGKQPVMNTKDEHAVCLASSSAGSPSLPREAAPPGTIGRIEQLQASFLRHELAHVRMNREISIQHT
jgi:hypothetical protein